MTRTEAVYHDPILGATPRTPLVLRTRFDPIVGNAYICERRIIRYQVAVYRSVSATTSLSPRELLMSEVPRPATKPALLAWVNEQRREGIPQWPVYLRLSKMQSESVDIREMEAISKVMESIEDVLVERNLKGAELEKNGQEESAIALYEADISGRFDGSHPYNRLRIIYKNRRDYVNAIRVCEAYINNGGTDRKLCESFRAEIAKLHTKLFKA